MGRRGNEGERRWEKGWWRGWRRIKRRRGMMEQWEKGKGEEGIDGEVGEGLRGGGD